MSSLIIKQPQTKQERDAYYQLRWELLAKPWGQDFTVSQDDREDSSHHLMAIHNTKLVGIGRLHFNTQSEAQIRYMGVMEEFQNKGIGRALVKALEQHALSQNRTTIVLNAREKAIPFYERLGYSYLEEAHVIFEVVKHVKMMRNLTCNI